MGNRRSDPCPRLAASLTLVLLLVATAPVAAGPTLEGPLPGSPPGPLFPTDNWWSADVSSAPLDPSSASYIQFVNNCTNCCPAGRRLHPDFGGDVSPGSAQTYGIPY